VFAYDRDTPGSTVGPDGLEDVFRDCAEIETSHSNVFHCTVYNNT
jgi:hypothetical protein